MLQTESARRQSLNKKDVGSFLFKLLIVPAVLWVIFFGIFREFPYLTSGAEVIYRAKLNQEFKGSIFQGGSNAKRVLIFGTSEVLAGFVPDYFDQLASADHLNVLSYNSGYPARSEFVAELQRIVTNKSNIPDVILLTEPWEDTPSRLRVFHATPDDHTFIETLFPFRNLLRDSLSFAITAQSHGGLLNFYRESGSNVAKMLSDRGYYFIEEQSHYPNDSLPDDFTVGSDTPETVYLRTPSADSQALATLNAIVSKHNIKCFYVPDYVRNGSAAPAPARNQQFATLMEQHSSCKVLGPDYFTYPNRMFSDVTHLNPRGARSYTADLYRLIKNPALER